ncbi:MAG: hypothetical protein ACI4EG_00180 [Fusicatenibacter sp.]|nr:hypothetical protein [Fusicatenibacter sp.]
MKKRRKFSAAWSPEREITAEITWLEEGVHVLLVGGRSHVGAISYAQNGHVQGYQAMGHKEQTISDSWAKGLSVYWSCPVTVCCGIHYDEISKEEIQRIVNTCEELLQRIWTEETYWERNEK